MASFSRSRKPSKYDTAWDAQWAADCERVASEDCDSFGDDEDVCNGCPAFEALKKRIDAGEVKP